MFRRHPWPLLSVFWKLYLRSTDVLCLENSMFLRFCVLFPRCEKLTLNVVAFTSMRHFDQLLYESHLKCAVILLPKTSWPNIYHFTYHYQVSILSGSQYLSFCHNFCNIFMTYPWTVFVLTIVVNYILLVLTAFHKQI